MATESYQGGAGIRLDGFYNSILNGVNRAQQQQALQQQSLAKQAEADQKELANMVAKVNTTGVQKIDIPEMTEKLNGLYEKYYSASKAESKAEKLLLRAELQQDIQGLGQFVDSSKTRGQQEVKLVGYIYNPSNSGLIPMEARERIKQLQGTPTSKLDPNIFNRENYIQPDTSYLSKTNDDLAKNLLANASVKRELGKAVNILGKREVEQFELKNVPNEVFSRVLEDTYKNDTKYRNQVDYLASKTGVTPSTILQETLNTYSKSSKLSQSKQIANESGYKPSTLKTGGSGTSSSGTNQPISINIPYGTNPSDNVQIDEYVPVSIPSKNFAGVRPIDLTTGKTSDIALSSGEYSIVGIGNVPLVKSGSFKGAVSQPNYTKNNPNNIYKKAMVHVKDKEDSDYFIPYDRLPVNIRDSKAVKAAIGAFKPATNTPTTTTPTAKKETTVKKGILD